MNILTASWISSLLHNFLLSNFLLAFTVYTFALQSYSKAFEPSSLEECLDATVRITIIDVEGKPSYGSGFFLNEGESTYVYTNAHVVNRAEKIEITDHSGKRVTDIEWIEAFAEPFGVIDSDSVQSGDGVRLKLKKRREKAFKTTSNWEIIEERRRLVVFGDNEGAFDGKNEIEILEGELIRNTGTILTYDCKTKPGSSGGAVVCAETMEVVALNTWVTELPSDPYLKIFGKEEGVGIGFGVVLKDAKWHRFTVRDYLAQGKAIQRLQNNLELMILLSYLVPTAHGVYVEENKRIGTELTLKDALDKHKDTELIKKITALDQKLSKNITNKVKISNMDIYKSYLYCLDTILRERETIIPGLQHEKLSYYHKDFMEKRYLVRASFNFSGGLSKCRNWFKQKTGVGGSIPANVWETLPPFGEKLSGEIVDQLLKK